MGNSKEGAESKTPGARPYLTRTEVIHECTGYLGKGHLIFPRLERISDCPTHQVAAWAVAASWHARADELLARLAGR
jgi:hypothetical protein